MGEEIKTPGEVQAEAEVKAELDAAAANTKAAEDAAVAAAAPLPTAAPAEEEIAGKLIVDANAAAERIEKANIELARLLTRQEAMKVEEALGGTADAGQAELSDEEKSVAQAKKFIEGTGFEDELFPDKKK